jgi:aminoglycoside 6'-N-acetyltransferase I
MQVRRAVPEDLEALVAMCVALWPDAPPDDHRAHAAATLARTPRSTLPLELFVAEDGHRLIGFIEVGLRSHADGCDETRAVGFVEGWYVADDRRREGVGRALMKRAEAWARSMGPIEIGSDTWIDNEASLRAHVALGFEVIDRCVHLRKTLGSATPYAADLARLHHEHFGDVARAAARELRARLDARGIRSGTVVDLATGSGGLARGMSDVGFNVWGVDLSEPMLAIARAEAPGATFVQGSLWTAALPPCVAVAAVGEALSYATDATRSFDALFGAIHDALAPGGLFLFDVASPGRSGPSGSRQAYSTRGGTFLAMNEREEGASLTRSITLFVPTDGHYRRVDEMHVLELHAPGEIEAALDRAGFVWRHLERYAALDLAPGWNAYLAVKGG